MTIRVTIRADSLNHINGTVNAIRPQEGTEKKTETRSHVVSAPGWITLRMDSALEAVGLTAAVARELADAGVSCNVVAGFHYDHLFVQYERAAEAVTVLEDVARRSA